MNREKVSNGFAKILLAIVIASAIFGVSAQAADTQAIVVTTPFNFSVDNQHYAAGTYEFSLLSDRFLSVRNVKGVSEEFFLVRQEQDGPLGVKGGLVFQNSNGHRILKSVYVPGTDMSAALIEHPRNGNAVKTDRASGVMRASLEKPVREKQNAALPQNQ
jgi:opacity protein-like surface antigen